MKKLITVMTLSFAIAFAFAGCAAEDTAPELVSGGDQTAASEISAEETSSGFGFEYKGLFIAPGVEASGIIDGIDDPYEYYEGASCAYVGMDRSYDYGFMVIYTYESDEGEFVSVIEVKDDIILCNGIKVGDDVSTVESVLGPADETYEGGMSYTRDGITMQIVTANSDTVTSIIYGEAE